MAVQEHKHSYVFFKKTEKKKYFRCADPNCLHFVERDLIIGKESLCPACQASTLILTTEMLKRKVPKCLNCAETNEAKTHRAAHALLNDLKIFEESAEKL